LRQLGHRHLIAREFEGASLPLARTFEGRGHHASDIVDRDHLQPGRGIQRKIQGAVLDHLAHAEPVLHEEDGPHDRETHPGPTYVLLDTELAVEVGDTGPLVRARNRTVDEV